MYLYTGDSSKAYEFPEEEDSYVEGYCPALNKFLPCYTNFAEHALAVQLWEGEDLKAINEFTTLISILHFTIAELAAVTISLLLCS